MNTPLFSPAKPASSEYAPFYRGYVESVPSGHIFEVYKQLDLQTRDILAGIPEQKAGYRYAEDKWSIRELVGHVADAERVFAYRALRFSRGDQTPLPGFEEKAFTAAANFEQFSLDSLSASLSEVRRVNHNLFAGFSEAMFDLSGVASGSNCSVRALLYITIGHGYHHLNILRERYL